MATRPETSPEAEPIKVGFFESIDSIISQAKPPAQAEIHVTKNALAEMKFAASSLPALKPNQPNNNSADPNTVNFIEEGLVG